jgi:uncharacterized protein YndB with AHSA1/START domain
MSLPTPDRRFDPGPVLPVGADHRLDDDRWTLVLTRDLHHPIERVWAALTDPEQLARWAPFEADRDLGSEGSATLTMIDGELRTDLASAVTRAEPLRRLEYSWGTDVLRWELTPTPDGTRLTLRHTVQDRDWLAKVAAGWHLCLLVAQRLLDGRPIDPIRGTSAMRYGWEQLNDAYAEQLGVPVTPSPPRG